MTAPVLRLPHEVFALSCARQVVRRADATALELADAAQVLQLWGDYPADHMRRRAAIERIRQFSAARMAEDAAPRSRAGRAPVTAMSATIAASPVAQTSSPTATGATIASGRKRRKAAPAPNAPAHAPAATGRAGAFSTLARWAPPILLGAATGYVAALAVLSVRALTLCTATGC